MCADKNDVGGNKSHRIALAKIISVIAFSLMTVSVFVLYKYKEKNILSEDAVLQANVVHISPAIPGKLSEILVREGDRVKRGDVLFRLEGDVYKWRLQQAKAELAIAEATLNTRSHVVKAESANAVIAQEQITRAQRNLALARRTLDRLRPLVAQGYAAQQELDIAVTAERDAQVSLSQAGSQLQAAQQLVGHVDAAQAAVQVTLAAVEIAQKALDDTEIKAPHDGLVVGLRVSTGELLVPGQSLFTLVDSEHWYARAIYLETELGNIPIGTCASVYVLASPKRELQGTVVNIGWGVNSEEVLNLPRSLPYVQKSLNWVRISQRFPVQILLKNPPPELMRMGASATVTIRSDQLCQ